MERFFILLCAPLFFVNAATTIVDSTMEIVVPLPPSWQLAPLSDSECIIVSDSSLYKSNIFISRTRIADPTITDPRQWTEAHFIAYKYFVETSSQPLGSLLWFDTTTAAATQPVQSATAAWAPWALASFISVDTSGIIAWSEYQRYTAARNNGYDMFVLGDTADMRANYTVYAAILRSIQLLHIENPGSIRASAGKVAGHLSTRAMSTALFDVRGRRLGTAQRLSGLGANIVFLPMRGSTVFVR
jgi:hypothetical protein